MLDFAFKQQKFSKKETRSEMVIYQTTTTTVVYLFLSISGSRMILRDTY